MNTFNEYENKMVDYFKTVKKNASQKEEYKFVFLSKRFLEIYKILVEKYPEIELPNVTIHDNFKEKFNDLVVYLNDINYDYPDYINTRSLILICNKFPKLDLTKLSNVPSIILEDIKKTDKSIFYYLIKEQIKHYNPKKYRNIYSPTEETALLNFLALELEFLVMNNYNNPIELMPDYLKNYFYFYAYNEEEIKYFLNEYYKWKSLKEIDTIEEKQQLKDNITLDMINKFNNLTTELKLFLVNNDTKNAYMFHHPITNKGNNKDIHEFRENYLKEKISKASDREYYEEQVDELFNSLFKENLKLKKGIK